LQLALKVVILRLRLGGKFGGKYRGKNGA